MTDWRWNGGTADWYTGGDWVPAPATAATFPQPGDTATIATGLASIVDSDIAAHGTLNSFTLDVGSVLDAQDEIFGPAMLVENNLGVTAKLALTGFGIFQGTLIADGPYGSDILISDTENVANSGTIIDNSVDGSIAVAVGTFINTGLIEELSTQDTIALSGSVVGNNGTIAANLGGLVTIASQTFVANLGTLIANAGTLDVTGSLNDFGLVEIGGGGTVMVGAVSGAQSIAFIAGGGTLVAPAKGFAGLIEGFGGTNTVLDVAGLTATSFKYNVLNGNLILLNGTTIVDSLEFGGQLNASNFHIGSDGHGGELVTGPLIRTLTTGGDFYNSADWTTAAGPYPNSAPLPGDTVLIATGTASISAADVTSHGTLNNLFITLGSGTIPAVLSAAGETFGPGVTLDAIGSADLALTGASSFGGYLLASAATIPGLNHVYLSDSGIFTNTGTIFSTTGDTTSISATTFVNNGDIDNSGIANLAITNGVVLGSGDIELGGIDGQGPYGFGTLTVASGVTVAATQHLDFTNGTTNELLLNLAHPGDFAAQIDGFVRGDTIVLQGMVATNQSYDPTSGNLTLSATGAVTPLATLNIGLGFPATAFTLNSLNGATTLTTTTGSSDGSDEALGGPQARAADNVTGAGLTIGIISNSFNSQGGEAGDQASGDLPTGAALNVLRDDLTATEDEGMAMAELVHRIAPGATIDFYSGDGQGTISGPNAFAMGVNSLVAAGAKIIVDDLAYGNEPDFEQGTTIDQAISAAVAAGVDYFSAAGNDGDDFYSGVFTDLPTILPGGTAAVNANDFGGGNAYQAIYIPAKGSISLTLQWDQPFANIGNSNGPVNDLTAELFDPSGKLVKQSSLVGTGQPVQALNFINTGTVSGEYRLALIWDSGSVAPGQFEYIVSGNDTEAVIDDAAVGTGNVGNIFGHEEVQGSNVVGSVNYLQTPAFGAATPIPETATSRGAGEEIFNSTGTRLTSPISEGEPNFLSDDGAATGAKGFNQFYGTSAAAPDAAAVAALMLQVNPKLTTAQVTQLLEESTIQTGTPADEQGAGLIQATIAVQLADAAAACYRAGTRIATEDGDTAIERLQVGQKVRTVSGGLRAILWTGHRRIDCRRHPMPEAVWPVRVRADAFDAGVPCRDLWLSRDHAVLVDGVLMPIGYLVNGSSIAQIPIGIVEYWHVELAEHDILLAEGLPAESYLDTGNRAAFANGAAHMILHPDFAPQSWEQACAELVVDGPRLQVAKQRLFRRAGPEIAPPLSLEIRARGRILAPRILARGLWSYALPPHTPELHLLSPPWSPAACDAASLDRRTLGVRVLGVRIDGRDAPEEMYRAGAFTRSSRQPPGNSAGPTAMRGSRCRNGRSGSCCLSEMMQCRHSQGRKQFFFEKKNQKTFCFFAWRRSPRKSFLLLFFKKEGLTLLNGDPETPSPHQTSSSSPAPPDRTDTARVKNPRTPAAPRRHRRHAACDACGPCC